MEAATETVIEGIGDVGYGMLKEMYCRLQELRTLCTGMYEEARSGAVTDFSTIQAAHILMEDIFSDLERFLLAVCSEDENCSPAMCELDR